MIKNNQTKFSQSISLIPKKIDYSLILKEDAEKFNNIYKIWLERIKEAEGIEKYMLCWAIIEQMTLPSLIRFIFCKLKLKNIPSLEDMKTSQMISCYYFISHDEKLYSCLVFANKERNKLIHDFPIGKVTPEIKKKLKENTTFVLKNIFVPILERLTGKKTIPVLTLYGQGWNDFRSLAIKIIKDEKDDA